MRHCNKFFHLLHSIDGNRNTLTFDLFFFLFRRNATFFPFSIAKISDKVSLLLIKLISRQKNREGRENFYLYSAFFERFFGPPHSSFSRDLEAPRIRVSREILRPLAFEFFEGDTEVSALDEHTRKGRQHTHLLPCEGGNAPHQITFYHANVGSAPDFNRTRWIAHFTRSVLYRTRKVSRHILPRRAVQVQGFSTSSHSMKPLNTLQNFSIDYNRQEIVRLMRTNPRSKG